MSEEIQLKVPKLEEIIEVKEKPKKIMFMIKDGVKIQVKPKSEQQSQQLPKPKPLFNLQASPSTSASVNITNAKPIDLTAILARNKVIPTPKLGKFSFSFTSKPKPAATPEPEEKPKRALKRPARYMEEGEVDEKQLNLAEEMLKIVPSSSTSSSTKSPTESSEKCGCSQAIPEVVNQIRRISSRLDVLTRIMQSAINAPHREAELKAENTRLKLLLAAKTGKL